MIYIFAESPEKFRECKKILGIDKAILIDFTQEIEINKHYYFVDYYSPMEFVLRNIENPVEYFMQISENYKEFEKRVFVRVETCGA